MLCMGFRFLHMLGRCSANNKSSASQVVGTTDLSHHSLSVSPCSFDNPTLGSSPHGLSYPTADVLGWNSCQAGTLS